LAENVNFQMTFISCIARPPDVSARSPLAIYDGLILHVHAMAAYGPSLDNSRYIRVITHVSCDATPHRKRTYDFLSCARTTIPPTLVALINHVSPQTSPPRTLAYLTAMEKYTGNFILRKQK